MLGAVVLTGDRVRSLFVASEETVTDGIAGLPLPEPGGGAGAGGQPPPAAGQGTWSGDGAFVLDPFSTPQARTFTLTNVGAGPLALLGAPAIAGTHVFQILASDCAATLPPGDSCEVLVQATAGANGAAAATLSIAGVPGGVVLSRIASGFDPALAWSGGGAFVIDGTPPANAPFTAVQTFTLANQGFADATGVAPAISGPDADAFSLTTDCPPVLPQGTTCTVTVTAAASDNGSLAATLSAGGPASVAQPISGIATGFAAILAWTAVPADFSMDTANGGVAQPATAEAGPAQTATLTNTGTLATGPVTVGLVGPDAAAFTIVSDSCSGQPLAPGASCTVDVALAAGLFPGDYSLQLTAAASPTVAAPARTQRVVGPRLLVVFDRFDAGNPATLDHATWSANGNAREIRYQNVGNASTGPMTATDNSGLGFTYTHALVGGAETPITDTVPNGTLTLAVGETGRLRIRLRAGSVLNGLQTLVAGPNAFSTGPVAIGGFVLPTISATYTGIHAATWTGIPAANALDVATQSLASPTNASAGPTGNATLLNSGSLPLFGLTYSFAGANASSYERNAGSCITDLNPGVSCTVGVRLVAGQFPGTYQASARVTGNDLAAVDSAILSNRVVGPRLLLTNDNLADVSHTGNYDGPVRAFQVTNVGNAATPNVEVAGSGLIRIDFDNITQGRGFHWALYDVVFQVFPDGVLDAYNRPSTNDGRLRSVPAGGGLVLHVALGGADLLGNPTPPATYTTSAQLNFSTGGSLVLTDSMSATCYSPCRN